MSADEDAVFKAEDKHCTGKDGSIVKGGEDEESPSEVEDDEDGGDARGGDGSIVETGEDEGRLYQAENEEEVGSDSGGEDTRAPPSPPPSTGRLERRIRRNIQDTGKPPKFWRHGRPYDYPVSRVGSQARLAVFGLDEQKYAEWVGFGSGPRTPESG